ncbi:lysophospholipid acyltransferase family protein [soil metagenome]
MTYDPDALDRRDPSFIARVLPLMEAFGTHYLRLRCEGLENTPTGPTMFVANHNGGIMGPDLFCTLPVLWRVLTPTSPLYALAHDFAMRQFTMLGRILQKLGAVAASRANARRVFERGGQVLVYPGGDIEAYRTFERRNHVVILPRKGFVEVAQAAGVPIVPIVTHGAHRSAYIFSEGRGIARALRMRRWARLERFPLALALPWGLAPSPWLPYLPLPLRVRLRVLPAVHVPKGEDPRSAALRIQSMMQRALDEMRR